MSAPTANRPSAGRALVGVVSALDDWRPTRRQWRTWVTTEPALDGLGGYTGLRRALLDHRLDCDRKDDVLAALIRLAHHHDPDAATAVAACLHPGLQVKARRLLPLVGTEESWAVLLAGLCERIARYDLARRPRRIASNLIWDALKPLRRTADDHQRHDERTCALTDAHHPTGGDLEHSARVLLADARRDETLAPLDHTLIAATVLGGLTIRDAAALLGLDYQTAKKRRQRALARLADYLHDDPTTGPDYAHGGRADVIPLRPPRRRGIAA